MAAGGAREGARCGVRHRRGVRLSPAVLASARACGSRSPRGRCRTSSRGSCSRSSSTARVRSSSASRTTSDGDRLVSAPRVIAEPIGGGRAHPRRARRHRARRVVPAAPTRRGRMAEPRRGGAQRLPGERVARSAAARARRERRRRRAPRARRRRARRRGHHGTAAGSLRRPGLHLAQGDLRARARQSARARHRRAGRAGVLGGHRRRGLRGGVLDRRRTLGTEFRRIAIERQGPEGLVMSHMPAGRHVARSSRCSRRPPDRRRSPTCSTRCARAYHPDATVGGAYVQLLRAVLEPLGIAVLDAWHPAVRAAARPTLVEALRTRGHDRRSRRAARRLDRARGLPRAGRARAAALARLPQHRSASRSACRSLQAADAARRDDLVLSPNVLLRPVVERRLLPTVAYVGGAGEIAYFAQVDRGRRRDGRRARRSSLPRWSATVIEPAVDRMLGRLGMMFDEVKSPHAAERRIADRAMPAAVRDALEALRASVDIANRRGRREPGKHAARHRRRSSRARAPSSGTAWSASSAACAPPRAAARRAAMNDLDRHPRGAHARRHRGRSGGSTTCRCSRATATS